MGKLRKQTLSKRNKFARAVWTVVWILLFRTSPRILHPWRSALLRVFGAKIGKAVHVYPSAKIWAPWNLEMGDFSCLSNYVDCYCVDKITIGERVTVSQYSFLCTASHDYKSSEMPLLTAPITIGRYAWVTADVFVAPGITIGEGAVVTARSSVFSDVESWSIVAGNPASIKGKRPNFLT